MPRFIRQPREVEAICLPNDITIHTADGDRKGARGDWLVVGLHGDIYIVDGTDFRTLYEPADDAAREALERTGRRR